MQRLSSDSTVLTKRIYPAIFVGAIALSVFAGILAGRARTLGFFITPLLILAVGYTIWFFLYSELADEVTDHGAYLLVRVGAIKDRIPLANIKDVEVRKSNPPVLIVHLVQPCRFGAFISFMPFSGLPFAGIGTGKLSEMLLQRADAARRGVT